jgi:transcriptional regulator with GAF, ATPase, and Fis domain
LSVFPIELPPLRERTDDMEALTEHFLGELSKEVGVAERVLSEEALKTLQGSDWQGNVRELQHVIERAFILAGNETRLRPEHFPSLGKAGE